MKRFSVLSAFFCLHFAAVIFAQQDKTTPSFAGNWDLDVAKSKLFAKSSIESGTLKIKQTDKKLTVVSDFKRTQRPFPASNGLRGDIQFGGYGMLSGGTTVYNLSGKKTVVETRTRDGMIPPDSVSMRAEIETDGKLKITSIRSLEAKMGAVSSKTIETWQLLDGGKNLQVTLEMDMPGGMQTAELVFNKK